MKLICGFDNYYCIIAIFKWLHTYKLRTKKCFSPFDINFLKVFLMTLWSVSTVKKSNLTGEKLWSYVFTYKLCGVYVYVKGWILCWWDNKIFMLDGYITSNLCLNLKERKRKKVDSTSKSHFRAALLWIFIILISM